MTARHRNIPLIWLMTDERVRDAALLAAIARLPRGAGVIFRHYGLDGRARRALFDQVRAMTRRRGLRLVLAGDPRLAAAWGADGWHGGGAGRSRGKAGRLLLHSAPVHNARELHAAQGAGADLLFVSPVFPTHSHPGARILGRVRLALLIRQARRPVIALGGMNRTRAASLKPLGIKGWAAIDALSAPHRTADQNLKIVPR
jgi:thiamine-phosphate pyrophosphorylase